MSIDRFDHKVDRKVETKPARLQRIEVITGVERRRSRILYKVSQHLSAKNLYQIYLFLTSVFAVSSAILLGVFIQIGFSLAPLIPKIAFQYTFGSL